MVNPEELITLLKGEYSLINITFNDHSVLYKNAEQAIEAGDYEHTVWVSTEEKQKAALNNSVWIIQVYPDTPIGSYSYAASTFEAVAKFLLKD